MYTLTTNNKYQHWYTLFAAVSILNVYVVHDLNGLDACTVHEQDSIVESNERRNYVHTLVLLLACYAAHKLICV